MTISRRACAACGTKAITAAKAAIAETGAAGVKDMGRVMGVLRERHAGVIDLARAGAIVKQLLGG